jgi:hypothetical protein
MWVSPLNYWYFLSDVNSHYVWADAGLVGEHRVGDRDKQGKEVRRLFSLPSVRAAGLQGFQPSLHISILGKEVVQHSQRGLQVTVDNICRENEIPATSVGYLL